MQDLQSLYSAAPQQQGLPHFPPTPTQITFGKAASTILIQTYSLIQEPLCEGVTMQTFSILDSIITHFPVHCKMPLVLFLMVFYYKNCPPAAVTILPAASWCLLSFSIPKERINKLQVTPCILTVTVLQGYSRTNPEIWRI